MPGRAICSPQRASNAGSTVSEASIVSRTVNTEAIAKPYMNDTPAAEIARAQKSYFPDTDESVLADCIATYQRLGCWTPHVEITQAAYEKTLDVYEYNGLLKRRYRYEEVCAAPPASD